MIPHILALCLPRNKAFVRVRHSPCLLMTAGEIASVCSMPIQDFFVIEYCLSVLCIGLTAVAASLQTFGSEKVVYWREASTGVR